MTVLGKFEIDVLKELYRVGMAVPGFSDIPEMDISILGDLHNQGLIIYNWDMEGECEIPLRRAVKPVWLTIRGKELLESLVDLDRE